MARYVFTLFIVLIFLLNFVSCTQTTPDIWISKAKNHLRKNEFEKAVVCLDKALELEPDNVYALYRKGITLSEMGKNEEAITYLDRVLELEPENVDAWINKGVVYYNDGDYENALVAFEKALQVNPENKDARTKREDTMKQLNKDDDKLLEACINGDLQKIKEMLKDDPFLIDAKDWNGETPLHKAAFNGHLEVVEFLIEKGSDVNAQSYEGLTPLSWAKDEKIKKLLKENGAEE